MIQFTPEKSYEWAHDADYTFDAVFGLNDLKNTLIDCAVNKKESVFLYGPPGCGKTMLTHALAGELGAKLCNDVAYQVLNGFNLSDFKKNIKRLFEEARAFDKVILFLDEIDKSCYANQSSNGREEALFFLLQEMKSITDYAKESGKIIFPIAATCKPWDVHPIFIDKNGFDKKLYVGLPDDNIRKGMINKVLRPSNDPKAVFAVDIDEEKIISQTKGFTTFNMRSLLEYTIEKAIMRYFREGGEKTITQTDFEEVFSRFVNNNSSPAEIEQLQAWGKENS